MKMKLKKGIRKQLITKIVSCFKDDSNYYGIVDILEGTDLYPDEVEDYVASVLDETCSNGHFSRWTAHGCGVFRDAQEAAIMLSYLYQELALEVD